MMEHTRDWVEMAARLLETLAVVVIVSFIVAGTRSRTSRGGVREASYLKENQAPSAQAEMD